MTKNSSSVKQNFLSTKLLKSVSRSFYLSLRVLPKVIRDPLSLAYLLARATDTIADTNALPISLRIQLLMSLRSTITKGNDAQAIKGLQKAVIPLQTKASEKSLIENLPYCFDFLATQNDFNKIHINETLQHIIQGQLFDLYYFNNPHRVIAILSEDDLESYIYQVAGCVGEFWTKMCFQYLNNFTDASLETLLPKAVNFGKGLQLTNILRDIPADIKLGRLYLPIELTEICKDHQVALAHIFENKPVVLNCLNKAKQYLTDGWLYSQALNNRRIRFACLMPIYIARETIALLEDMTYLQRPQVTKISRKQIYWLAIMSLLASNNKFLDKYYYQKRIGKE